jgi:WD40 repeat protein
MSGQANKSTIDRQRETKVFVSYSRADIAFVDRLDAALKARGITPLIDRHTIYAFEDWWRRIEMLISSADTVVFVLSPDAVTSEVCEREVTFAATLNKRLAPIVCRRVSESTVPAALRRLNFIFFDDESAFDNSVEQLVEALQTDIAWIRRHTEFGESARRWAVAGRPGPRGLLLRSPLLEEAEHWIAMRPEGAPPPTPDMLAFVTESRRAATARRNVVTTALATGLLIAIGLAGLAYWQREIAVKQEQVANEQRKLADQQRGIAERNEAQVKEQRNRALLAQSRFLADQAERRHTAGDEGGAMLLALEALTPEADGEARPYVPEAEATLFNSRQRLQEIAVLDGFNGFSSDWQRALIIRSTKVARVWDPASGKTIAAFMVDEPQAAIKYEKSWRKSEDKFDPGTIRSSTLSPDGRKVVLITDATPDTLRATLWDATSGKLIADLEGYSGGTRFGAVFSPDSRRILAPAQHRVMRVYDAQNGGQIAILKGHEGGITDYAFDPDGRRVATVSDDDKTLRLWDARSGQETLRVPVNSDTKDVYDSLEFTTFSPDGRLVIAGSSNRVRIWDSRSGQKFAVDKVDDKFWKVAFSADGRRMVTGSRDTIRVWDVASLREIAVINERVADLVLSADGQRMVTLQWEEFPKTARVWDVSSGREIAVIKDAAGISGAAFSPDGLRIATTPHSSTIAVRLWDTLTGQKIAELSGLDGKIIGFSPDGHSILTRSSDGPAVLWNSSAFLSTGMEKLVIETTDQTSGSIAELASAVFSPDGQHVLIGAKSDAQVWNLSPRSMLRGFVAGGEVWDVAISPDRRWVSVSTEERHTLLWEWSASIDSRMPSDFSISPHEAAMYLNGRGAVFSADGRRVMTFHPGAAIVWDIANGNETATFPDGREHPTGKRIAELGPTSDERVNIRCATLSPDGRQAVIVVDTQSGVNSKRMMSLWEVDSGREVAAFQLPNIQTPADTLFPRQCEPLPVSFNPDGRRVVLGSVAGTSVWDIVAGKEIGVLKGQETAVNSATFSPDGLRIVTSSDDRTARLWDADSGKPIGILRGHNGGVNSAVFSPDGRLVMTTSADKTAQISSVFATTQELVAHAQSIVSRCLTQGQRAEVFLAPEPPAWCIEMEKWPYQTADWKDWLKYKRASANPPLPDTPTWPSWIAARRATSKSPGARK